MANRDTERREPTREENAPRQSGPASESSTRQAATSGQSRTEPTPGGSRREVDTSERERPVSTTREGGHERERSALTRRPGESMAPWNAPAGSPFALMRRVIDDMDRLFDDFGRNTFGRLAPRSALSPFGAFDELDDLTRLPISSRSTAVWAPPLEIFERGDELVVRADLPGLSKDNVNVDVENGVLTVSGERRQDYEDSREGYYRSERRYGTFSRSIPLPEGIDEADCKATFKDGVLEVTMPKPKGEPSRRRRIDIK
jgi:HSP20 family protein